MRQHEPVFLTSLESRRFEPVRECRLVRRLRFDTGKDCALVRITPPVSGQDFDIGEDIETVIVSMRHEGTSLFPISEYPLFVFIGRLIGRPPASKTIARDDVQVIGWGELYASEDDARAHRFQ